MTKLTLASQATLLEKYLKAQERVLPTKLNGPCTLTIKNRQGQYRHRSFIGSEELVFNGAYAGKSGKVILVFRPVLPADYAYVEMDSNAAVKHLSGWQRVLDDARFFIDEDAAAEREQVAAIEARREAADEVKANELYGSW